MDTDACDAQVGCALFDKEWTDPTDHLVNGLERLRKRRETVDNAQIVPLRSMRRFVAQAITREKLAHRED